MASSGASRDLNKAINTFFASPKLPLPDDLTSTIEAYLDKHSDYDQSTSDRLHDDLLLAFTKSVQNQPTLYYASLIAILRRLRPSIRSPAHVLQWWEKLIDPVLGQLNQDRGFMPRALNDISKFLVPDDEDEGDKGEDNKDGSDCPPSLIAKRLLQKWMDVCSAVQVGEDCNLVWAREKPVQDVIAIFGKRRPKDFFLALNHFFVQKDYRTRSITLLSEFIRSQPPNLYLVIRSPLFDSLLRCLQHDTSTTVVSLALTALTMLLPNMPGSIVPVLPALFNIYARILFWDREPQGPDEAESEANTSKVSWEKCAYSPSNDNAWIPHFQLLGYYTILYGLYPLNFMDYIRKPQRYLRHANMTGADDVEVQPSEIRDRSEQFRQCHLLHPNFYSLTIESEKTDFGRWMRSATADVVAECVGLHVSLDNSHDQTSTEAVTTTDATPSLASTPLQSLETKGDQQEEALLRGSAVLEGSVAIHDERSSVPLNVISPPLTSSSQAQLVPTRKGSQSSFLSDSHAPGVKSDSPTLSPLLSQSVSRTDLQGMIDSNKAIKSQLHQSLTDDSVPPLSLSSQDSALDGLAMRPATVRLSSQRKTLDSTPGNNGQMEEVDGTVTQMRRQILLLKNDLGFERYMVQQHLAHIGALRRSNMKQVVTEAETQKLIMINRTLKNRLEEAKKTEAQVKKEAEMSRNRSKSWEESLATRLKKLREEQKKWSTEETRLRTDLKNWQSECTRLVAIVCDKEVRELKLEQDMKVLESSQAERERMHDRLRRLAATEQETQRLSEQLAQAQADLVTANNVQEVLHMKMEAREAEFQRAQDYLQKQIATLNAKLAEVLKDGRAGHGASLAETRKLVEGSLAASRAKNLELQKNLSRLTRKCKILESKVFERISAYEESGLRGDNLSSTLSDQESEPSIGTFGAKPTGDGSSIDGGSMGSGGSGGSGGGPLRHGQRLASDSGTNESTPSRNTPMPGSQAEAAGRTSPQADRYYGRGGVQNSSRKERKDKKKEEPADKKDKKDKKDKRPGGPGIRGIRGFV